MSGELVGINDGPIASKAKEEALASFERKIFTMYPPSAVEPLRLKRESANYNARWRHIDSIKFPLLLQSELASWELFTPLFRASRIGGCTEGEYSILAIRDVFLPSSHP